MKASRDDLDGLLRLQQIDLDMMRQRKQLAELPQREKIVQVRARRSQIQEKHAKVKDLKKDAEKRLSRINDEDSTLVAKAEDVQAAIDATRGDYRNVEARTKELEGIAKRRKTLEGNRAEAQSELDKISDVEAQIELALEELDKNEAALVASFQREGGELKASLAQLEDRRKEAADGVSNDIESLYEQTLGRTGGVAIGVLKGSQCGVCRAAIEGGRLIELKAQAPLGTCPACKRLLVVE